MLITTKQARIGIAREYHKCYMPLPDVYQLGGTTVFHHLSRKVEGERNLLIAPLSLVDELEELSRRNFSGAVDTLEYLSALHDFPSRRAENMLVREVSMGLDILFLENKNIKGSNLNLGILSKALEGIWQNRGDKSAKVITNVASDIIRYDLRGIETEKPKFLQVSSDIVHEGIIEGSEELYAELQGTPRISVDLVMKFFEEREKLWLNQVVKFRRDKGFAYALVEGRLNKGGDGKIFGVEELILRMLAPTEEERKIKVGHCTMNSVLGISPKDMEQYIAMQYGLMNNDVTLSFLCGSQGSGKTLLSYVCAVDQVLWYDYDMRKRRMPKAGDKHKGGIYQQIVLLKPNDILGGKSREVGFLPGSLYDKLRPHLGPYIDAHRESVMHELFPFEDILRHPRWGNDIFSEPRLPTTNKIKINDCAHLPGDMEAVQMTYSGHMRGRSFQKTLVLLDEAQNFTPYEVKTILERLGPGCKAIVMGDPRQVDNPLCSREINGLTHAIAHFMGESFMNLVTLPNHYRSQVSEVAGKMKVYANI